MRTLKHDFGILCSGPMSFVIRRAPSAFTGTERRGRNARSWRLFTPPSGPMRHGLKSRTWLANKWEFLIWPPANAEKPCSRSA